MRYDEIAREKAGKLISAGHARILAIESSCDETSAAVVDDGRIMLSNPIASQIKLHEIYGGVVPGNRVAYARRGRGRYGRSGT